MALREFVLYFLRFDPFDWQTLIFYLLGVMIGFIILNYHFEKVDLGRKEVLRFLLGLSLFVFVFNMFIDLSNWDALIFLTVVTSLIGFSLFGRKSLHHRRRFFYSLIFIVVLEVILYYLSYSGVLPF